MKGRRWGAGVNGRGAGSGVGVRRSGVSGSEGGNGVEREEVRQSGIEVREKGTWDDLGKETWVSDSGIGEEWGQSFVGGQGSKSCLAGEREGRDVGGDGEGSGVGGEEERSNVEVEGGDVHFCGTHEVQPLVFHPTDEEWRVRQCARLGLSNPLFLPKRCPTQDLGAPLELNQIVGDGNCLYRAFSLELCGSQNQHMVVREKIIDIMCNNHQVFSACVDGDIGNYLVHNTIRPRSWGSTVEIFVAATLLHSHFRMLAEMAATHPPFPNKWGRKVRGEHLPPKCM